MFTEPGESFMVGLPMIPNEELGTYAVKANRISAELRLEARVYGLSEKDPGRDWYIADVTFFTKPSLEQDKKGASVTAHYSAGLLERIFERLKAAEAGFEEILKDPFSRNRWEEEREVMRCIISLEDQTKHLYEERAEARRARAIVRGH